MSRHADQLGIQAPSIYKHLNGRDEILTVLHADADAEFGSLLTQASLRPRRGSAVCRGPPPRGRCDTRARLADREPPLDSACLSDGMETAHEHLVLATADGDRNRAGALGPSPTGWSTSNWALALGADLNAAWETLVTVLQARR